MRKKVIVITLGLITLLGLWYFWRKIGKRLSRQSEIKPTAHPKAKEFYNRTKEILKVSSNTAKLVTAVAMHETGNFESMLYFSNHNAFGMKMPQIRDTTAIVEKGGYAYYDTIDDSIRDFELWFNFHKTSISDFSNPVELTNYMKSKGYFEDTLQNYQTAVVKHFNTL